jgi:hypothetical protein
MDVDRTPTPDGARPSRPIQRSVGGSLLAVAAVLGALASPGEAAAPCTDTFVGANNTKWSEPANWNTGHVPAREDVVCIPSGVTASLWHEKEVPSYVSVKEIHGGSVFTNTELYLTGQPSEGASTLESLGINGTHLGVEGAGELRLSHELFINGYSSTGGHGSIVLEPGAVGELGEVGCTTLNVNNTKIVNRGTLHVGRRYVGGMIIGLINNAQIINEGVLGMDTQVNELEDCPPRETQGATIYRGAQNFPYIAEALVNRGTIQTEWGANESTIGVPVTNDGVVVAREGALAFSDGTVPTECSTGTWESTGAPLKFTDGTFNITPGVSLAAVEVQAGASVGGCPSPSASGTTGKATGGSSSGVSAGADPESTRASPATRGPTGKSARCVVPRIRAGATLKSARHLLVIHNCRLGRVYHVQSRKIHADHVIAFADRAGTQLRGGAAVAVSVAETRRAVSSGRPEPHAMRARRRRHAASAAAAS